MLKFKSQTAITSKTIADALGVSHRNMLNYIKKAEKYERKSSVQSTLDTAPLFGDYTYESRGKNIQCKLMNKSAILILIKVVDSQEAYDYFKVLLHNFGLMELEREVRKTVISPTKTLNRLLSILQDMLKEELPKSAKPKLIYIHVQNAINKTITGKAKSVDRETLNHLNLEEMDYLERLFINRIVAHLPLGFTAEEIRADVLDLAKYLQKENR